MTLHGVCHCGKGQGKRDKRGCVFSLIICDERVLDGLWLGG